MANAYQGLKSSKPKTTKMNRRKKKEPNKNGKTSQGNIGTKKGY